jgi:hypothetical protein
MRVAVLALLACGLATGAVAGPPRIDDPVLRDVERAFATLRADRPAVAARARAVLADVAAALDDLADERASLEAALGGDDGAAWRGLPHERVFILLTLAALDVDAGRCDLALPTLKNALHHRDRGLVQRGEVVPDDDHALADVLRARCAIVAGVGDVEAARAALRARPDGEALHAAATAPALVLEFVGRAPGIAATGVGGEQGRLVWRDDDAIAFTVTIGGPSKASKASSSSMVTVHDLRQVARPPGPAATARRAAQAAKKSQLQAQATQYASRGQGAATQAREVRGLVGAGLLFGAAAGLSATTAAVDTRVDTRTATAMPASIRVKTP